MTTYIEPEKTGFAYATDQPYRYVRKQLIEPDWRRYPGWAAVTESEWRDAQWQRAHSVKNIAQLRAVMGDLLDEQFYADLAADQQERATMSMLLPPQMLNTMTPLGTTRCGFTEAFYADPIRRYMLPVLSDRDPEWTSHPYAERDSLHESDMWATEGLTHRYPTKVLAELLSTCPQYCGHCTRMDLVGNSTPTIGKTKLDLRPADRQERMLDYLRATPSVRDVVVSGGDVANLPWPRWKPSSWSCSRSTRFAISVWRRRLWQDCRSIGCRTRWSTESPGWRASPRIGGSIWHCTPTSIMCSR